jgi:ABC-type phosphate transport system ATPase subunit
LIEVRRRREGSARQAFRRCRLWDGSARSSSDLADRPAGTLRGGEQKMFATARAIMMNSDRGLLDEPSAGLTPILLEAAHCYSWSSWSQLYQSAGLQIAAKYLAHSVRVRT